MSILRVENRLFKEWRLRYYGLLVTGFFCLKLGWVISADMWPFGADGRPACDDFGVFWLSGKFAVTGDAVRVYDYPAFFAALLGFFGSEHCVLGFNRFFYPPTFLLYTYALGFLPYVTGFVVWIIVSLGLYLTAVYAIMPRRTALIVAASPCFVFLNIILGQNGLLTAALLGLSLVFMERRPVISGIFVGLLTYKPHFGLLIPIALLASRNWRVLGSAALTAAVLCLLATIAFGFEGWAGFIEAVTHRTAGLGPAPGVEVKPHSLFGLFHWAGASLLVSWSVQLGVSVIVALGIWVCWAKSSSYNLKAAALCAGSLIVSPYALGYDLTILTIAAIFLVNDALLRGFLPGERLATFMCWFSLGPAAFLIGLPIGPVICAILLILIARRIAVFHASEMMAAWPAASSLSHG